MDQPIATRPARLEALHDALKQRILVLDGAMGTMIQSFGLDETAFRGARFDAWNREVRGNNDLLNLTRPDPIRDIHLAYFRAGADIVAANTFSSTRIAQADYGMEAIAYELNFALTVSSMTGRQMTAWSVKGISCPSSSARSASHVLVPAAN